MVVIIHNGRTYESKSIVFPKKAPWSGVFSFSVPPGTYEVGVLQPAEERPNYLEAPALVAAGTSISEPVFTS